MSKIKISREGARTEAEIAGTLNENSDLSALSSPLQRQLHIKFREVEHINSMGVKCWVNFMTTQRQQGVEVHLYECSPSVVEQINLVPPFAKGAKIHSVCVPFVCEACGNEMNEVSTCDALRAKELNDLSTPCTKCSALAPLDDIAEEYFAFLKHR